MTLKKYINGLEIEPSVFVVAASGEKWFEMIIPFGIHGYKFYVQGNFDADAIDAVADFLEENKMTGLYETYDDIWEKAESMGLPFDDYEEQYIIAGNHGIYITELISIKEM